MSGPPLAGQVVLVTGAGRNLGRATALRAAELGADVGVLVRSNRDEAEQVQAAVEQTGRRAFAVTADVADADQVERAVAAVTAELGAVTSVLSCAAYRSHAPTADLPLAQWRAVLATALDAAFHLTRSTVSPMVERGFGRFVFLGGSVVHTGLPTGTAAVATAKAGLSGFVRSFAQEFGRHGITANVVAPAKIGPPGTGALGDWDPANSSALGRNADYAEVVDLCLFLCSPAGAALQGQTIHADGGIYGFGD